MAVVLCTKGDHDPEPSPHPQIHNSPETDAELSWQENSIKSHNPLFYFWYPSTMYFMWDSKS